MGRKWYGLTNAWGDYVEENNAMEKHFYIRNICIGLTIT